MQENPNPTYVVRENALQDPAEEESSTTTPGWSKKWIVIGAILVISLVAAVFLGARMVKAQSSANGGNTIDTGLQNLVKGGAYSKSNQIDLIPAKEIPQEKLTTKGLFLGREDQRIFLGTGQVQLMAKDPSGSSGSSSDVAGGYYGPVVEVVITHETKIYLDITEMDPPEKASSGTGGIVTVQQVVKPGSLDDLGKYSTVYIWGDKQGDRYIAKVITFR